MLGKFFPIVPTSLPCLNQRTYETVENPDALPSLTVYDYPFPNLNMVNQFVDNFTVKFPQVHVLPNVFRPFADCGNFLIGFADFLRKSFCPLLTVQPFLFVPCHQNRECVWTDCAADFVLIEPCGPIFQISYPAAQSGQFLSRVGCTRIGLRQYPLFEFRNDRGLIQSGIRTLSEIECKEQQTPPVLMK